MESVRYIFEPVHRIKPRIMKIYTTDILANEFDKTTSQIRKIMAAINHIHPNPESLSTKVGRSLEISQDGHDQIALYLSLGDDGYRETHGKTTFDRTSTVPGGSLSVAQESGALGQSAELPIEINQEDEIEINQSVIEGRTQAIRDVALELEQTQVYDQTKAQLLNAIDQQKAQGKLASASALFADVIQRHQARQKSGGSVKDPTQDNNELLKALGLGK